MNNLQDPLWRDAAVFWGTFGFALVVGVPLGVLLVPLSDRLTRWATRTHRWMREE